MSDNDWSTPRNFAGFGYRDVTVDLERKGADGFRKSVIYNADGTTAILSTNNGNPQVIGQDKPKEVETDNDLSPYIETSYDDRTFYDATTIYSVNGLFSMKLKPIKSINTLDGNGTNITFSFMLASQDVQYPATSALAAPTATYQQTTCAYSDSIKGWTTAGFVTICESHKTVDVLTLSRLGKSKQFVMTNTPPIVSTHGGIRSTQTQSGFNTRDNTLRGPLTWIAFTNQVGKKVEINLKTPFGMVSSIDPLHHYALQADPLSRPDHFGTAIGYHSSSGLFTDHTKTTQINNLTYGVTTSKNYPRRYIFGTENRTVIYWGSPDVTLGRDAVFHDGKLTPSSGASILGDLSHLYKAVSGKVYKVTFVNLNSPSVATMNIRVDIARFDEFLVTTTAPATTTLGTFTVTFTSLDNFWQHDLVQVSSSHDGKKAMLRITSMHYVGLVGMTNEYPPSTFIELTFSDTADVVSYSTTQIPAYTSDYSTTDITGADGTFHSELLSNTTVADPDRPGQTIQTVIYENKILVGGVPTNSSSSVRVETYSDTWKLFAVGNATGFDFHTISVVGYQRTERAKTASGQDITITPSSIHHPYYPSYNTNDYASTDTTDTETTWSVNYVGFENGSYTQTSNEHVDHLVGGNYSVVSTVPDAISSLTLGTPGSRTSGCNFKVGALLYTLNIYLMFASGTAKIYERTRNIGGSAVDTYVLKWAEKGGMINTPATAGQVKIVNPRTGVVYSVATADNGVYY